MTSRFPIASRLLHWTMAVMVLAMLFIGIAMVASLADYHCLVAIHRPLGILILVLVAIRLVNRLIRPAPPRPSDMPAILRFAAHASQVLLYALMVALPLVGWAMLSAAGYPIVLIGAWHLPPILPHGARHSVVCHVPRPSRRGDDARPDFPRRRLPLSAQSGSPWRRCRPYDCRGKCSRFARALAPSFIDLHQERGSRPLGRGDASPQLFPSTKARPGSLELESVSFRVLDLTARMTAMRRWAFTDSARISNRSQRPSPGECRHECVHDN
jgi:cytochrome b561